MGCGMILHGFVGTLSCYDDVIKWKHFPRYWPIVRGIHQSPMNSPHKGQWRGALTWRDVTRSFDVFFDMCHDKRPSKQSRRRRFETLSCSLLRHCNGNTFSWRDYSASLIRRLALTCVICNSCFHSHLVHIDSKIKLCLQSCMTTVFAIGVLPAIYDLDEVKES